VRHMRRNNTSRPDEDGAGAQGSVQPDAKRGPRVVVLGPAGLEANAPLGECIGVCSAYEAAAEILSAPTAALVVDLRLLTGRHLRLLDIARRMEVEIFAVGAVPPGLTGEDLSQVRMMARAELGEALRRLGESRETSDAPPPVEPPPVEAPAGPPPEAKPQDSPSALLSAEELAALLEGGP